MNSKALATALLTASLCVAALGGCGSSNAQAGSDQQQDQVVSSEASSVSAESVESGAREGQAATVQAHSDEGASYSTREIQVENDGESIYGVAYVPEGVETAPLVIFSHGLGNTHAGTAPYAQELAAHGYAAYVFDFRGGAMQNQSDGETTEMSVMTEASDLETVIDASESWDFVDHQKVVLAGESQGGMVTAVVAARHPDVASALVLLYPALSIVDDMHDEFSSESDIPQTYELFGWMEVGRNYATDVWNYDVYGEIGKYAGPVLIEHGSEDSIVPISYSRRAAKTYANATLDVLKGAGHGFTGDDFDTAVENMLDFLDEHVGN